jgi:hypothetical protein
MNSRATSAKRAKLPNATLKKHPGRTGAVAVALRAILLLLVASPLLTAQKKPSFRFPLPPNTSAPAGGWKQALKQKAAEEAMGSLLNNQLPLKLDANAVYPTVLAPPGGPFAPRPLALNPDNLDQPIPPGDYTIPIFAFCTEYSVHRPGYGLAYRLGPLQGKAADAIGALLWRGLLEKGKPPQQLQAVSWAIQSGLRYVQMPQSYQAVIDEVIPDYRNQLSGDFVQNLEDVYSSYAKSASLPPLEQMLTKMGKPGELALSARKQRVALLRQNTTDQVREQTLFAGQESGVYTPVKAEEGPWTERIPGVAYIRFKIKGGNMAGNNVMEIRIVPQGGAVAKRTTAPRLLYASYRDGALRRVASPMGAGGGSATPRNLTQGSIGCAVGLGAQCLIPVPVVNQSCPAGQTYHPPVSLTNLEKALPKQCAQGQKAWPTTVTFLQVSTGNFSQLRCNGIEFQVTCPAASKPHLVQFVSEQICPALDPNHCVEGSFNAERSYTCSQTHPLTQDPRNKAWSLDSLGPVGASGQDPYYEDGVNGSPSPQPGVLITADQPSMLVGDPNVDGQVATGNYILTKSFTDFVLCGNSVMGEFKWQRSSSGGYTVGTVGPVRPGDLNQFRNITQQQGYLPWW